jgi:hypothetical protein
MAATGALGLSLSLAAQQAETNASAPKSPEAATVTPSTAPPADQDQKPAPAGASTATDEPLAATAEAGAVTEDELRRMLVGTPLYLRGGYLDNTLNFTEHGQLVGHSPQGSYTLNGLEIDKVRLTKHKVELEGIRYGLHFVGQLAYEDPAKAVDRVRITPKKKIVKITIDRELVVTPKKKKEKENKKAAAAKTGTAYSVAKPTASSEAVPTEAEQVKASAAEVPEAERPADMNSVTTTVSPAHAAKVLMDALDKIFAPGLDERMMASLPEFWKLYYQAAAAHSDYRPKDPAVLRQSAVDRKARLETTFEPPSNEYAQANAVAGMALYHTVIGPDGKPQEIAVGRPIGFGLDENAVESIRKASFTPALKDGKPVPVLLDLVVQFRIYSKRTSVIGPPEPADQAKGPVLPGPYSVNHSN